MTPSRGRQRASIFFFDGWISISASVMGTATELCRRGYDVDIYFNSPSGNLAPPELPAGVTLHEHLPWTRRLTRGLIDRLRRKKLEQLSKINADENLRKKNATLRAIAKAFVGLIEIPQFAIFCRFRAHPTDLAIAFDMNSLMAMDFALPSSTPFVYWSLEIWKLSDLKDFFSRWMKRHELRRMPQARAVVVQSEVRRAILEEDLPGPLDNYVEVPNAPAIPMPVNLPQTFFSDRFPIPENTHVVLHSGFISTSLMSLEIAQTVGNWPDEFVLVFHERQQRDPGEAYIQAVQIAGGARTFLSLRPVPFSEVDLVYAGADIGLVCYQTAEANEATAWASSGKLVYYLRHAMPIIVVMPQCPPILNEWQCGEWVADLSEIGNALSRIASDYENYSLRAKRTYDALFNFPAAFDRLMQAVNAQSAC